MAAITNQAGTKKQQAMQRAEGLTDIWDIFKAWMGRAAEIVLTLCMFAQLIGMLPGIAYPGWANNTILGVQIIMLDFGAFALAPLAEHARNTGQEQAAKLAEDMAKFLIRLVIFTIVLITIGQFSPIAGPKIGPVIKTIVGYAEPVLILVRVGFVVKYIHVIHSLRSSTLAIEPTHQPTSDLHTEKIEQLEKTIEQLNERLSTALLPAQHGENGGLPTSVIEVSTPDLYRPMKPLHAGINRSPSGLHLLAMAAQSMEEDEPEEIVDTAIEASPVHPPILQYPNVQGVSPEKVRQLIDMHLAGTAWSEMRGNYSQTIKPVRKAYELLVQSPSGM
jgi:hypothetical protein